MIARVRAAVVRYDTIGIRIEDDDAMTGIGLEWLSRPYHELGVVAAAMAHRGR